MHLWQFIFTRRINMGIPVSQIPSSWQCMMANAVAKTRPAPPLDAPETNADKLAEKEIHKLVLAWLGQHDIFPIHSRMDRKTTQIVGIPDFLFCYHGKPWAIEIKMPGKGLREEQQWCMDKLAANGWNCRVCHSLQEMIKEIIA